MAQLSNAAIPDNRNTNCLGLWYDLLLHIFSKLCIDVYFRLYLDYDFFFIFYE